MEETRKEKLRRQMGELAAMPADDPARRELEEELAREGDWAEHEWRMLLEGDRRLRSELRQVDILSGFKEKLLAIPYNEDIAFRQNRLPWRSLAAAAVLLLALSWIFILPYLDTKSPGQQQLETVALLAINNHVNGQDITVMTPDPEYLEQELSGTVPFKIVMPKALCEINLLGGKKCALGTHPVIYTHWESPKGMYSLFQFRPVDFGLPQHVVKEVIHSSKVKNPAANGYPCHVAVWSEQGRGYVMVSENAEALDCLSPASGQAIEKLPGKKIN